MLHVEAILGISAVPDFDWGISTIRAGPLEFFTGVHKIIWWIEDPPDSRLKNNAQLAQGEADRPYDSVVVEILGSQELGGRTDGCPDRRDETASFLVGDATCHRRY